MSWMIFPFDWLWEPWDHIVTSSCKPASVNSKTRQVPFLHWPTFCLQNVYPVPYVVYLHMSFPYLPQSVICYAWHSKHGFLLTYCLSLQNSWIVMREQSLRGPVGMQMVKEGSLYWGLFAHFFMQLLGQKGLTMGSLFTHGTVRTDPYTGKNLPI